MELKKGIDRIKNLLEAIKDTDIEEIYFERQGLNIGLARKIMQETVAQELSQKEKEESHGKKEIIEVVSHSVGIFRDFIPPARKHLAKIGDRLNNGQKIGFIESMRIMKEIVSPVKGIVVEKFVKHGDPVEYGQRLFRIEVV
jgi:biotin carboxyl carrier protein